MIQELKRQEERTQENTRWDKRTQSEMRWGVCCEAVAVTDPMTVLSRNVDEQFACQTTLVKRTVVSGKGGHWFWDRCLQWLCRITMPSDHWPVGSPCGNFVSWMTLDAPGYLVITLALPRHYSRINIDQGIILRHFLDFTLGFYTYVSELKVLLSRHKSQT